MRDLSCLLASHRRSLPVTVLTLRVSQPPRAGVDGDPPPPVVTRELCFGDRTELNAFLRALKQANKCVVHSIHVVLIEPPPEVAAEAAVVAPSLCAAAHELVAALDATGAREDVALIHTPELRAAAQRVGLDERTVRLDAAEALLVSAPRRRAEVAAHGTCAP
jgi:hypothetical protein